MKSYPKPLHEPAPVPAPPEVQDPYLKSLQEKMQELLSVNERLTSLLADVEERIQN